MQQHVAYIIMPHLHEQQDCRNTTRLSMGLRSTVPMFRRYSVESTYCLQKFKISLGDAIRRIVCESKDCWTTARVHSR